MTEARSLVALFCDDVRHEVGNKYSLMGCYGDELIIEKLPALLPKLCVQLRAQTPLDRPFKKLIFRAFLNDDLLAEIEMPEDQLEHAAAVIGAREDALRLTIMAIMGLSPLAVSEPSILRVEAETEDGVLRGGHLRFRQRTADDPPI